MKDTFTLKEIAEWQLKQEQSIVELPSIQRGFVWKPKQVEDLWDSILRGYPVGSFMLSRTGDKLHLMDGQQRATSIFLGHFNPFNPLSETKAWSIKGQLPVVWIDLKSPNKPSTSKYLIRLTTQSHPWGYQAINNDSKLSVTDRREALELFRKHADNQGGYTSFKNSTVFPYEAYCPLPLCFFLESNCSEEVIEKAEQHLPDYFATKKGGFENKSAFLHKLRGELNQELIQVFNAVKKATELKIKSNIIEEGVLYEEQESENPTLFVRINSAGTTLTGDDLIYSIYKATFPETRDLIEDIRMDFISPTQVVSLANRIVSADIDGKRFPRKMNVRDFQRRIKNTEFKSRLEALIKEGKIKELFEQALKILSFSNDQFFKDPIPPVIIKNFIRNNHDLFLFLVYWLHINKAELNDNIKLKMVAKLLTFAWFGFDNLPKLWNTKIDNPDFWNEPLNELIWWDGNDGIHFLIPPDLLKGYYQQSHIEELFKKNDQHKWGLWNDGFGNEILQYFNRVKSQNFDLQATANEYFWRFINKIRYNKQMILFAQRSYINLTFSDFNQIENIEDTNAPWDWDHIYPDSWVYNMKNCPQVIRDWNGTIGNFRAVSLELNRSRGNKQTPAAIAEHVERENSFILAQDWTHWQKIDSRLFHENCMTHFRAVTSRMISIYEKFWNDLKIHDLIKL